MSTKMADDIDLVSGLSRRHLNFILDTFMTAASPVVGLHGEFIEQREATRRETEEILGDSGYVTTLVGSGNDGLLLPSVFQRSGREVSNDGDKSGFMDMHQDMTRDPDIGGMMSKIGQLLEQPGGMENALTGANPTLAMINVSNRSEHFAPHSSLSAGNSKHSLDIRKGMEWGDIDMFSYIKDVFVGNRDQMYRESYRYYIDTQETQPGYLRLHYHDPNAQRPYLTHHAGIAYFSSQKMMQDILQQAEAMPHVLMKQARVERNGPALTTIHTYPEQREIDKVIGLACPIWPHQADEWVKRKRYRGWPPEELRNNIINCGCHVVPAAHKQSKWPEVEWRWSFVLCEQNLANSLTVVQRQSYLILKTMLKYELTPPELLSTYCLKNHLFWCMEKIPNVVLENSETSLVTALLFLIDELIHALVNKRLPHYFLPSNNLIGHIPDEFLIDLTKKLVALRKNPLEYILRFDKNWIFSHSSTYMTLDQLMSTTFTVVRSICQSDNDYVSTKMLSLCNMIRIYIVQSQFDMGFAYSKTLCNEVHSLGVRLEPVEVFQAAILRQEMLSNAIFGVDFLIAVCPDQTESLLSLSARLNASMFCREIVLNINSKYLECRQISEERFKQVLTKTTKLTPCIVADYALLLRKLEKQEEAIHILSESLSETNWDQSFTNSYYIIDKYIFDSHIKEEIEQAKMLKISTLSLTYYQLVQCYIETGMDAEAEIVIEEFRRHLVTPDTKDVADYVSHLASVSQEQPLTRDTNNSNILLQTDHVVDDKTYLIRESLIRTLSGRVDTIHSQAFQISLLGYCFADVKKCTDAGQMFMIASALDPSYSMASRNAQRFSEYLSTYTPTL